MRSHFKELKNGKHCNTMLQRIYDQVGEEGIDKRQLVYVNNVRHLLENEAEQMIIQSCKYKRLLINRSPVLFVSPYVLGELSENDFYGKYPKKSARELFDKTLIDRLESEEYANIIALKQTTMRYN
jgi:hypothetical protein